MSKRAAAVEATKRRIVEATRELHNARGVAATSWDDIAQRAGVGVGTVYRHFPSLDELIPACGEVSLAVIAMPEPASIPALFDGADGLRGRLERMVGVTYGMYERGADDLRPLRAERDFHPVLSGAATYLDTVLGSLVDAALAPVSPTSEDRKLVLGMIELGTWRTLREQGLGPDETAAAVTEMLAARFRDR
jgi:AcrR family transcriptional regulator